MNKKPPHHPFHSAEEEVHQKRSGEYSPDRQYKLAFTDQEFLLREELRSVRLQLELLRPELTLREYNIHEALVFFGSSRIPSLDIAGENLKAAEAALSSAPNDEKLKREVTKAKNILANSRYLKEATHLAFLAANDEKNKLVTFTGGGPSFMEAANKGASDANTKSVALNVFLPHEQMPNPYVTPELTFQFHYFSIRKMHFLMRAKALVAFPGGFGTLDEVLEVVTLMQTQKISRIPLLLFHENFWRRIINFEALVDEGTISQEDLDLFQYVETAEQAWKIVCEFYEK